MRSSSQKDFAVYDFNEEQEAVEAASAKFVARSRSLPNPEEDVVTKYTFLQAFSSGLNPTDETNISCIDLQENGSPQGSVAIDSPERDLASNEKSEMDDIIVSSYEEHGQICLGEYDPETLVRVDPFVRRVSSLIVPSVANKHVSELQSNGMPVDVISDNEESCTSGSRSPSTSASDLAEDEDDLERPVSDDCYTAFTEMDNDNMTVVVSPDYVIYGNSLYEEAQLMFYPNSIMVECLNATGKEEKFVLQWSIDDIIHIECQWSGSVEAALVKFRLRAATLNGNEKVHDNYDVVKLIFAVTDMSWLEKERKIKSLAARYKDIWNVLHDDDLASQDDVVEFNMLLPKQYFTEIPDSFPDVVYPVGDPDAVSISKRDIELLHPDTFINDTIIDFYIKYLKSKIQPNEKHRFHFFNSFFFRKLADLDKDPGSASEGRAAFLRVRKWTRKLNIFEKDYIFIPVNFNFHWSLLVICHPGEIAALKDEIMDSSKVPCILHMDSIKGSHSGLKNLVQSYLWEEWKERHPEAPENNSSKFSNLRFVPLELPQQENSFDCGLFLLHYVELFLEQAPVNFSPFKITKFSSFLSVDWFSPAEASFKRSHIRRLIYGLLNDPSQRITPTSCSDGHFSSGCCDNDIDQEPAVEFLSEQCSPSKVPGNSACSITDKRIEINTLIASSMLIDECNKQEELVLCEFLEIGATSISSFEHRDHAFDEKELFQVPKCATSPREVHADESEQSDSSSLDKGYLQPARGNPTTQVCSTSFCPKDVGELEMPSNSIQKENGIESLPETLNSDDVVTNQSDKIEKKENGVELLPETLNNDDVVSNRSDKIEKPGSVSMEDCGYVPDSPVNFCGENQEGGAQNSQETDTNSTAEGGNGKSVPEIKDSIQSSSGKDEECQECMTAVAQGGDVADHWRTNSAEVDGQGRGCQEIGTSKAESEDGEDCLMVDNTSEVVKVRNSEGCQKTTTEADGNDRDCHEIGICKREAGDGEDSQVVDNICELEGRDGDDHHGTYPSAESKDSCEESLPSSSQDVEIANDENPLDKTCVGLKRDQPRRKVEQQYQKRRRVFHADGGRRRTRSCSRDYPL